METSPTALVIGTGSRAFFRGLAREEYRLQAGSAPWPVYGAHHAGVRVFVSERHGQGHSLYPHELDPLDQMLALRRLGVSRVIAVYAAGSLRNEFGVGSIVLLKDFLGWRERPSGALDGGPTHLSLSRPYCSALGQAVSRALSGYPQYRGAGTYIQTAGPRYETPAEVQLYASWGADVVGMTGAEEAVAARMLGLCFAGIAVVTNLGTGLSGHPPEHYEVEAVMHGSLQTLRPVLLDLAVADLPPCPSCSR